MPVQSTEYTICEFCGHEVQMIFYYKGENPNLNMEHNVCPNCDKLQ